MATIETNIVPNESNDEKQCDNNTVDPYETNRVRAIDELIHIEQTYVDNVHLLNEFYYKPLTLSTMLNPKDIETLFGDTETMKIIIGFNDMLLNALKNSKQNNNTGAAMLTIIPFLNLYENYINKHGTSTKLLSTLLKTNKDFNIFLSQQRKTANGHSLSSLLMTPIQRINKYELILNKLIKVTPATNSDLSHLKLCLSKISATNKCIDDTINQLLNQEKLLQIQSRFVSNKSGKNISLLATDRYYIKEGFLKKISRKRDIKYLFILFTDLLIYCSIAPNNKLKLHQTLEFKNCFAIKEIDNNRKYGNNCFQIQSIRKSFLCVCESTQVRDLWCTQIQQCLTKMACFPAPHSTLDAHFAPIWFPDDFSEECMSFDCNAKFTFTRRRYHCQYCGNLICLACSKYQLPHFNYNKNIYQMVLDYTNNKLETLRVGIDCFKKYQSHFGDIFADKSYQIQRQSQAFAYKKKRSSLISSIKIKRHSFTARSRALSVSSNSLTPSQSSSTLATFNALQIHQNENKSDKMPLSWHYFQNLNLVKSKDWMDTNTEKPITPNHNQQQQQLQHVQDVKTGTVVDKFRVVMDNIALYKDVALENEILCLHMDNEETLDGYYFDDSLQSVYLCKYKLFVSSMDVREVGDEELEINVPGFSEIILSLDEFMKNRPKPAALHNKNILIGDCEREAPVSVPLILVDVAEDDAFRKKQRLLHKKITTEILNKYKNIECNVEEYENKENEDGNIESFAHNLAQFVTNEGVDLDVVINEIDDTKKINDASVLILEKMSKVTIRSKLVDSVEYVDCIKIVCKDSNETNIERTLTIPCDKLIELLRFDSDKNTNNVSNRHNYPNIGLLSL